MNHRVVRIQWEKSHCPNEMDQSKKFKSVGDSTKALGFRPCAGRDVAADRARLSEVMTG